MVREAPVKSHGLKPETANFSSMLRTVAVSTGVSYVVNRTWFARLREVAS